MTVEQAEAFEYNILDLTKIWPHAQVRDYFALSHRCSQLTILVSQYPLRPIGKLTLNANVQNYFGNSLCSFVFWIIATDSFIDIFAAEIEQLAFSTSNFPAGIEPSADPVLQSRMFS
jgi:catalase